MRYLFALAAAALLTASCSGQGGDSARTVPPGTVAATLEPTPAGDWTAPRGTPVPKPGWKALGFRNVTVSAPEGILASSYIQNSSSPDVDDRPLIIIRAQRGSDARILIAAETGLKVYQTGSLQDLAVLQPVLDTVRFMPLDPETAPWPYAEAQPPAERGTWGSITYSVPEPLTGIDVGFGVGSADPGPPGSPGPCHYSITVRNGRSEMFINACTGEPRFVSVDPEDAEAFARFVEAIKVTS